MSAFSNYLRLGYEHILSLEALDHILFIVALMAIYQAKHWLKVVIAVSCFTLGHSLTLSLGAAEVVKVDKGLIEFLIPLTIVLTALYNLTKAGQNVNFKVLDCGNLWTHPWFGFFQLLWHVGHGRGELLASFTALQLRG